MVATSADVALYNETTQWCTLLDEETIRFMDFANDIKEFNYIGGGYSINYEMASVLLRAIFDGMETVISGNSSIVGNFRFAHAETTLPLMTLMGFGDRTPLRGDFSLDQITQRGFRASLLAPFAANIEFRLFEEAAETADDGKKYYVQVRLNEQIAAVPGCDGLVMCPLEKLKTLWHDYLIEYDFARACAI